ncbi:MAG: hypothetical protein J6Y37_00095 [Paludibacteraceae bacterium]|nr:hypothetical protein [Paludibacteraceae bacterium]
MTQENKVLLHKELCARLPHGVIVNAPLWDDKRCDAKLTGIADDGSLTLDLPADCCFNLNDVKPYLRPMSSMTDEEVKEFYDVECIDAKVGYIKPTWNWHFTINGIDWLNAHHFDYRRLIERGLAIEVTEENNPYKK